MLGSRALRAFWNSLSNLKGTTNYFMKNTLILTTTAAALTLGGIAFAEPASRTASDIATSSAVTNPSPGAKFAITEMAAADEDLSTFVAALRAAEMEDTFLKPGEFTVFAPSNDAFDKLPEGKLEELLKPENKEMLTKILNNHVIKREVKSTELSEGELPTEADQKVAVKVTDAGVTVGEATVVKPDLYANNGVIHVVDTIIMPAE